MSFVWPSMLLALLAVPVLVAGYVALSRRRTRRLAELGTMGQLRTRAGKPVGRRRHVPAAVFLAALVVLIVGLARPQTTLHVSHRRGTVILAFDTSNSMIARDIKPSRIAAAQKAARTFVAAQPSSIRIGVVGFANEGYVLQKPTSVRADVVTAIGELRPNGATSLGSAILTSLDAIAGKRLPIDPQALQAGTPQKGLPFLGSAVVVLLSDGEDTSQLDPVAVADVAAQTGVRVDPIGLGTANGAVITVEGVSLATSLDATSLRQIAKQTNGTYYQADHAASLVNVYRNVSGHLQLTTSGEKTEITSVFAGAALLLVLVGAALSMRWFGRVL